MTEDELIAKAREQAKDFEHPGEFRVTLDMLPKVRVLEAAVVCFESDEHEGRIEVYLDRQTGKFISATLIPPKAKESKVD